MTRLRTIGSLQIKPSGSGDENGESLHSRTLLRMTTRDLCAESDAGVERQDVWGGWVFAVSIKMTFSMDFTNKIQYILKVKKLTLQLGM